MLDKVKLGKVTLGQVCPC